jgi:hypothetical protein
MQRGDGENIIANREHKYYDNENIIANREYEY